VVCAHNFFRRKGTKPILQVTVMEVAQVLQSTQDNKGATAPAPKLDNVVCAKGGEADFASYFTEYEYLRVQLGRGAQPQVSGNGIC